MPGQQQYSVKPAIRSAETPSYLPFRLISFPPKTRLDWCCWSSHVSSIKGHHVNDLSHSPEGVDIAPGVKASRFLVQLIATNIILNHVAWWSLFDVDALVAAGLDCVSSNVVEVALVFAVLPLEAAPVVVVECDFLRKLKELGSFMGNLFSTNQG